VIVLKRTPRVVNYEFTYDQYRRIAGNARLMSVVATNCGESPREPDCVVRLGDVKESALFVSGNYFRALEIGTVLGRGFVDDDDRSAAPAAVAVISHRLWQRRFDADPAIVGKAIELDDKPFIVVGVVEPGFNGASIRRDIWLPLAAGQILRPTIRGMTWVELAGRLVPGASRAQAQAELQSLRVDSDKNTGRPVDILLVDTSVLSRPHVRAGGFLFFRVMFLGVVLVLLLACANDRKPAARAHADPRP
jgi:hypothetical protein